MQAWSAQTLMKPDRPLSIIMSFSALAFLFMQGCGTMADSRRWGEDVSLKPGRDTVSSSFTNALSSPYVLIPGAAALILQVDGMDERLSRWAVRHTPTTGSTGRAERLSSDLRSVSLISFFTSMLMTPSGYDPEGWFVSKAKGVAVQGGAAGLNNEIITGIKKASRRTRPNDEDDKSFPSGHAGNSALFTSLAGRNVQVMNIAPEAKTSLDIMLHAVMICIAWERVEAGVHYPSDVLAGIALGYFIGPFINDSFMGIPAGHEFRPVVRTDHDSFYIGIQKEF